LTPTQTRRDAPDLFLWAALAVAAIAVWLFWAPSSYGYVLGSLGEPRSGLVAEVTPDPFG
jgi:hypothetical protein